MIIMSQIYQDRLNGFQHDDSKKSSFNRIVFNTRFEQYSDFLWERLNLLHNSFIYNLDENTWENYSANLNTKKNLAETFLMLTSNMAKDSCEIAFTDKRTGKSYMIDDKSIMADIYGLFRYHYYTKIDAGFSRTYIPRCYKNAIIYTNGASPETLIENQKKNIGSVTKKIESLDRESQGIPEYYSPNKNIIMHAAMAIIMTVCEPRYNEKRINTVLSGLKNISDHRDGNMLENIQVKDIIFRNEVDFTNNEYRVIYEMFKLLGFVRVHEECESRNYSNYIRSVHEQSKNVDMLCFYEVFQGINAQVNRKRIIDLSEYYMQNDTFLLTDRMNVECAFMQ